MDAVTVPRPLRPGAVGQEGGQATEAGAGPEDAAPPLWSGRRGDVPSVDDVTVSGDDGPPRRRSGRRIAPARALAAPEGRPGLEVTVAPAPPPPPAPPPEGPPEGRTPEGVDASE